METNRVVLDTGANGHRGRNLVAALVQRGYRVRATGVDLLFHAAATLRRLRARAHRGPVPATA